MWSCILQWFSPGVWKALYVFAGVRNGSKTIPRIMLLLARWWNWGGLLLLIPPSMGVRAPTETLQGSPCLQKLEKKIPFHFQVAITKSVVTRYLFPPVSGHTGSSAIGTPQPPWTLWWAAVSHRPQTHYLASSNVILGITSLRSPCPHP